MTATKPSKGPVGKLFKSLTAGLFLFSGGNAMAIESPEYTVVYSDNEIEYRRYESYLVAETLIEGGRDYKAMGNEGFRRLFRYITGGNSNDAKISMTAPVARETVKGSGEKIAMTAPVQRSSEPSGELVAFMLPSKYTLSDAPQPTDPRIQIREVPEKLVAVVRYSGRWTDENFAEKKQLLLDGLAQANVTTDGTVQSALYDPPYTPPFMRRNEVMIEVSALPVVDDSTVKVAAAKTGFFSRLPVFN